MLKKEIKTGHYIILDIDECLTRAYLGKDDEEGAALLEKMMKPSNIKNRNRFYRVVMKDYDPELKKDIVTDFWGVKRPYLDEFLTFCEKYYKRIIVWSAGTKGYVEHVVAALFKNHRKPYAVLTRDDVVYIDSKKKMYHKPLTVIEKNYPGLIERRLTFFVDNMVENFKDNRDNGIVIPDFEPDQTIGFSYKDNYLLDLMKWFMLPEVRESKDVTKLNKDKIFTGTTTLENFPYKNMITNDHKLLYTAFN
jgi:hypothetical protein